MLIGRIDQLSQNYKPLLLILPESGRENQQAVILTDSNAAVKILKQTAIGLNTANEVQYPASVRKGAIGAQDMILGIGAVAENMIDKELPRSEDCNLRIIRKRTLLRI